MKLIISGSIPQGFPMQLLHSVCQTASQNEGVTDPCFLHLSITDDAEILKINTNQRNIAHVTDVLSFPSIQYPEGCTAGNAHQFIKQEWDIEQRAYFLGDIVISADRVTIQALDYQHSFERELCYLLLHGLLHLFGYDHIKKEDKIIMREKEEIVLDSIGQSRDDEMMLKCAREAMTNAYTPYSNFNVGSCLMAEDGRIYTGCNVENASFGLTNCAERTAIFKAVSDGATKFRGLAIAAESIPPWPCGACRQVLSEFCDDIKILVTWDNGKVEYSSLKELLPHSFSPSGGVQNHLGKVKK